MSWSTRDATKGRPIDPTSIPPLQSTLADKLRTIYTNTSFPKAPGETPGKAHRATKILAKKILGNLVKGLGASLTFFGTALSTLCLPLPPGSLNAITIGVKKALIPANLYLARFGLLNARKSSEELEDFLGRIDTEESSEESVSWELSDDELVEELEDFLDRTKEKELP